MKNIIFTDYNKLRTIGSTKVNKLGMVVLMHALKVFNNLHTYSHIYILYICMHILYFGVRMFISDY